MSHPNQSLISNFYEAFARYDAEAMAKLYHDEIEFSDPAFGRLRGEEARNMWRMLVERGKESLAVSFRDVQADGKTGSAHWTANYLFTSTGRKVHNELTARFEFKDGKIIRHTDSFNFWKWSRQALGTTGLLLGWTPFLKNKVRAQARKGLERFAGKVAGTQ